MNLTFENELSRNRDSNVKFAPLVIQMNRRQFVAGLGAGLALSASSTSSWAQSSPIRIGALNPVTGAGSPYGTGMQKMIIAAAESVNAAGGVLSRQIH
jgi:branched-chain amino acid transport system substrate-binding protein